MLLKDSGRRDFPASPLLGKLRFGYPQYVNFHKECCMTWPQPPCNRLCNSKMEYQHALKPTSTLKNFSTQQRSLALLLWHFRKKVVTFSWGVLEGFAEMAGMS